jgi:hypothetical protein
MGGTHIDGGTSKFGTCPTQGEQWPYPCTDRVDAGTTCVPPQANDAGTALPENCYCNESGFWECNSCPFSWSPIAPATCEPGTTCVLNSWEHGCDCICNGGGTWNCTPVTLGSHCPGSGIDAGV